MIIRKYGIELHRLIHEDIELVRQARNRDDIRLKMFDQRIIIPEQQEVWFESINNMYNYYYTIITQNKRVGIIYGKNMDYIKRENEGGMFIWDKNEINSGVSVKASVIMTDLTFNLLECKKNFVHIRQDNPQAKNYNIAMGYKQTSSPEWFYIDQEAYERKIQKLRYLVSNGKDLSPVEAENFYFPQANRYHHLYKNLPNDIYQKIKKKYEANLLIAT